MENLPTLMSVAGEILMNIVNTITENLDTILDQGITILLSLIDGITQALPDLVPKIVDIIVTITETLVEHAPEIIEARSKTYRSTSTRDNQINTTYHISNIRYQKNNANTR